MTANTNLERRVAQHYASEPPLRAPDRVLHAALATIETTRQRRGPFAPWRFPTMSTYAKVAVAAVVAIAVAAVVLWQRPSIGVPTATPTPPAVPTVAPSVARPPALTQTFTSNMHGISTAYPGGWANQPATSPWADSALPRLDGTSGDILSDAARGDHLFIALASQPLADLAGPAWADTIGVAEACGTSEPIVVDGLDGRLLTCDPMRALFWGDDRGYLVLVHRSPDEPLLQDSYTNAWFQGVLATVQVLPPDAGTASSFVRPFDYVLPGAPVFDYGPVGASSWEVRVPAYNEAGHPGGLIVQAIGGGRVDPCNAASAVLPLDPGADSVIEYLKSIPQLDITEEGDATVDGLSAREAKVTATAGADCPELRVWAEAGEPFITDVGIRVVVVDVDGEHIVVTVFGEAENPQLADLADAIIGSFRFAPTQ